MAQLVGHQLTKQKVAGLIVGQDTCLDCGFGPWSERLWEATHWCFSLTWMFLSLSFSLPCILSKNKSK